MSTEVPTMDHFEHVRNTYIDRLRMPAGWTIDLFEVTGVFYRRDGVPFRACLDIAQRGASEGCTSHRAGVVIVMMNPGSSKALDETGQAIPPEKYPEVADSASIADVCAMPARPDRTQYQIMRLMLLNRWMRVRVVNVSDFLEKDSLRAHSRIRYGLPDGHSIFDVSRRHELDQRLREACEHVVFAWGKCPTMSSFGRFVAEAQSYFAAKGSHCHGVEIGDRADSRSFMHPNQRGEGAHRWVETIQEQIAGSLASCSG